MEEGGGGVRETGKREGERGLTWMEGGGRESGKNEGRELGLTWMEGGGREGRSLGERG